MLCRGTRPRPFAPNGMRVRRLGSAPNARAKLAAQHCAQMFQVFHDVKMPRSCQNSAREVAELYAGGEAGAGVRAETGAGAALVAPAAAAAAGAHLQAPCHCGLRRSAPPPLEAAACCTTTSPSPASIVRPAPLWRAPPSPPKRAGSDNGALGAPRQRRHLSREVGHPDLDTARHMPLEREYGCSGVWRRCRRRR